MTNKIKTPPEDRIYDDDDGFFLRAASVCVRDDNESEVDILFEHLFHVPTTVNLIIHGIHGQIELECSLRFISYL